MPTPSLIERVAQYHKLSSAAVEDLCERFPAADVTDLRQPSPSQPEGKDGHSAKLLLRLPSAARDSASQWVQQLESFAKGVLAEFRLMELRAIRSPTLHLDVLHSSINFNEAKSVEKINLTELMDLIRDYRRALPSLPCEDQVRVAAELKALNAADPTTLRSIRSSGKAYVLRSITLDDQSLRSNVNHLVIQVGAGDALPEVFWGRPRRRRNDIKTRVPLLSWPGGHYIEGEKQLNIAPRQIHQL